MPQRRHLLFSCKVENTSSAQGWLAFFHWRRLAHFPSASETTANDNLVMAPCSVSPAWRAGSPGHAKLGWKTLWNPFLVFVPCFPENPQNAEWGNVAMDHVCPARSVRRTSVASFFSNAKAQLCIEFIEEHRQRHHQSAASCSTHLHRCKKTWWHLVHKSENSMIDSSRWQHLVRQTVPRKTRYLYMFIPQHVKAGALAQVFGRQPPQSTKKKHRGTLLSSLRSTSCAVLKPSRAYRRGNLAERNANYHRHWLGTRPHLILGAHSHDRSESFAFQLKTVIWSRIDNVYVNMGGTSQKKKHIPGGSLQRECPMGTSCPT